MTIRMTSMESIARVLGIIHLLYLCITFMEVFSLLYVYVDHVFEIKMTHDTKQGAFSIIKLMKLIDVTALNTGTSYLMQPVKTLFV